MSISVKELNILKAIPHLSDLQISGIICHASKKLIKSIIQQLGPIEKGTVRVKKPQKKELQRNRRSLKKLKRKSTLTKERKFILYNHPALVRSILEVSLPDIVKSAEADKHQRSSSTSSHKSEKHKVIVKRKPEETQSKKQEEESSSAQSETGESSDSDDSGDSGRSDSGESVDKQSVDSRESSSENSGEESDTSEDSSEDSGESDIEDSTSTTSREKTDTKKTSGDVVESGGKNPAPSTGRGIPLENSRSYFTHTENCLEDLEKALTGSSGEHNGAEFYC